MPRSAAILRALTFSSVGIKKVKRGITDIFCHVQCDVAQQILTSERRNVRIHANRTVGGGHAERVEGSTAPSCHVRIHDRRALREQVMPKDLTAEERRAYRELADWIREELATGRPQDDLVAGLANSGWRQESAQELVSAIASGAPTEDAAGATSAEEDATKDFLVAAVAGAIGGLATIATYAAADTGGSYVGILGTGYLRRIPVYTGHNEDPEEALSSGRRSRRLRIGIGGCGLRHRCVRVRLWCFR